MKLQTIIALILTGILIPLAKAQPDIGPILNQPGLDLSNPADRARAVQQIAALENENLMRAQALAKARGIPLREEGEQGQVREVAGIDDNGQLLFHITRNVNAAISTGANLINTSPYNLDGAGLHVGIWDAGSVLFTHQEFNEGASSRVNVMDGSASHDHATHCGGTIAAFGVSANAKGMAPATILESYNWTSDESEMTSRAATGPGQFDTNIYVSNHSYGYGYGWNYSSSLGMWQWTGTGTDQNAYDADFGKYSSKSRNLDNISTANPYYLQFWAAGNENTDKPGNGATCRIGGADVSYDPAIHPQGDGIYRNGYETVGDHTAAKNVMTIGAAHDAVTGGGRDPSKANKTGFSSTGPCDDGRIKPDLVGNGAGLYSPVDTSDTSYGSKSGTSMATPNVCGSAALLVEQYRELSAEGAMRAATLKGLLIHTATDVGNPGPDYFYGWGLANVNDAADLLVSHFDNPSKMHLTEDQLNDVVTSQTYEFDWDGLSPIRATLSWTDPAGTADSSHDNRTRDLVNDLNLKIIAPDNTEYFPFVMPFVGTWTVASMSENATTGVNTVDNVEQVLIDAPGQSGTWTVEVTHAGPLTNNQQNYSLILTGSSGLADNSLQVSSPDGGESYARGSTQNITWMSTLSPGTVRIELHKGGTLHTVLAIDEPDDNSFTWDIPTDLTVASDYSVMVISNNDPAIFDTSNGDFSISSNTNSTLAAAVDNELYTWTSSGNGNWFHQSTTTHDGIDAAESADINDSQSTSLETTIDGPGTLTFWWKVSSESGWDFLRLYVNNVEQTGSLAKISGDVDWVQKTVVLGAGTQTLKWTYSKDSSVSNLLDTAWVDEVIYTPDNPTEITVEQPVGTNLTDGSSTIDFGSINPGGSIPLTFTITNSGTSSLLGLSLAKSGADSNEFTLGTLGATTLAPGASTTFDVTYHPFDTGGSNATIHIASNDTDENPFDIALTGNGGWGGIYEVTAVTPNSGNTGTTASVTIDGFGFSADSTVSLTAPNRSIPGTSVSFVSANQLTCDFDLNGADIGLWTIEVTTPAYGFPATLVDSFGVSDNIFDQPLDGTVTGWTTTQVAGTNSWVLTTAASHTPDTSWFAAGPASKSTTQLTSEDIVIPSNASNMKFSFWHNYDLENTVDGGILELSIDGGSWLGIGDAGSGASFSLNGYDATINSGGNPSNRNDLNGLPAWTGNSGGFIQTIIDLDTLTHAGRTLRFRWTIGTDNSTASTGWYVDSLALVASSNSTSIDVTPPTITSTDIVDDKGGANVLANTPVTYTLTFSEDIDETTVTPDNFSNAGSSPIDTILAEHITRQSARVFTVVVKPTGEGNLRLQINSLATIADTSGNTMQNSTPYADNTLIVVEPPDTFPPTINSTDFVDDKSGGPIPEGTLVTYTLTFNEDIDETTVEASDFTNAGTSPITIGTITETSPGVFTIEVTPTAPGTLQLQISAGAVITDIFANALDTASAIADDTTITVTDGIPPAAVTLTPADDTLEVPTANSFTITFNEDIAAGTGNITLKNLTDATQTTIAVADGTQVSISGTTLTINPTNDLLVGKAYAIQVDATAIEDLAGNAYAGINDDTTWNFTSAAPPAIANLTPADNASNVLGTVNLQVTFDEPVIVGTGNITLKNLTDSTQTLIDVTDTSQVTISGNTLTVDPASGMVGGNDYAVQIDSGAVTDGYSNPFAGIGDDTTWNFSINSAAFADGFEPGPNIFGGTTPDVTTYTLANTSKQANTTIWVRSNNGFGSDRAGLIDETENGGANFTDPTGTQAYAFRYTNSGVTSAEGVIGSLNNGTTITVSFDVCIDGHNGGSAYDAKLCLFDPAVDRAFMPSNNNIGNTAAVLAQISGNAPDGNYLKVTFSYTVGDPVVDNDGMGAGTDTSYLPTLLGKDIGIRFAGATSSANIDNVEINIVGAGDTTPPTIAATDIVDDKGGANVSTGTLVTYTLTFDEDIDETTVTSADLTNAGSSTISIGTITETSPGVFTVEVTPTSTGTLQFAIAAGATIDDAAANPLDTTNPITDDTTITVTSAYAGWSGTFAPLTDNTPGLDFDGAGLSTGLEWIYGGDPTLASDDPDIVPTMNDDGSFMTMTFRRSDAALNDPNTTITIEYGSDLLGWTPAVHNGTTIIITETDDGAEAGVDLVQVQISHSHAVGNKMFTRIMVDVTP